jgi:hypothetical protein
MALGAERLQGYVLAAQSGWDGRGDRRPLERIVFRLGHGIRLTGAARQRARRERARTAPIVHNSHRKGCELHRFCVLCRVPAGNRLWTEDWDRVRRRIAQVSARISTPEVRAVQGCFQLSTGKWRCLGIGCRECEGNTRYCGLLLTCTTGSGIFSSAAVNRL